MESSSFLQDDYALSILTQAAVMNSGGDIESSFDSSSLPATRGAISTTSITNHRNEHIQNLAQRPSSVARSRKPDILSGYNPAVLSVRNMETLGYSPPQSSARNSHMNQPYHGIGSQLANNSYLNNDLGILNAESYDDSREGYRRQVSRDSMNKSATLPFGITGGPKLHMDAGSRQEPEEIEGVMRRRKKPRIESASAEDEEDASKKARGRPRVDTKDETAADRRRTQIRMAQRAYRHRKETTISSLEKKVQDLRGTNEEMSNIFISLYDFAVGKGLLQREPEFGQQLQSTTERFLALARATANDDSNQEENIGEESGRHIEPEAKATTRKTKGRKTSPQKYPDQTTPASQPWGGYTISKEDTPIDEIPLAFQSYGSRTRQGDLQIITRPTEDNASFPFDFMDIQQYRVDIPSVTDFSQNFLPHQLPLPKSYSYSEFSFARRIQRAAGEKAMQLLNLENPPEAIFQRVFGFCLLYETREQIKARFAKVVSSTAKETLSQWHAPFVHVGGAGTYYPLHDSEINGELMPKLRTGYSMGPFTPQIAQAQEVMQDDMRCSLPGFEGEFFDANDVDGYLRGRGLDIQPSADFVTAEIDLSTLMEVASPKSTSTATTFSPRTPNSPIEQILLNEISMESISFEFAKPEGQAFPFPEAKWDKEESSIDPMFRVSQESKPGRESSASGAADGTWFGDKRTVTVSVDTLLEELLNRAVCLGRAPGFRLGDVNAAIIAAVKAGFSV